MYYLFFSVEAGKMRGGNRYPSPWSIPETRERNDRLKLATRGRSPRLKPGSQRRPLKLETRGQSPRLKLGSQRRPKKRRTATGKVRCPPRVRRWTSVGPYGLVLQLGVEEVADAGEEMVAGVAAVDIVIAVRVDLHLKLLVGLHEGFAHFVGIAHVYVVIGCAVDE